MNRTIREHLESWSGDLAGLRQNTVLNESEFINFLKGRGIPVFGVLDGDPGRFFKRGWLMADGTDHDGKPLFHPFRIYPVHHILKICELGIAPASSLDPEGALRLTKHCLKDRSRTQQIGVSAPSWNEIVDLAICLEPLFWPQIIGQSSIPGGRSEASFRKRLRAYRLDALKLVSSLDPDAWRNVHDAVRISAAWMDENAELYALLRLSLWEQREKLRGRVSGALWLRHMAEVVRRGFEEAYKVQWPEEDQAFGTWLPGGRVRLFGSERPFDDSLRSKPFLAHRFGLFTGSALRWYVEGETEYYAVLHILREPSRLGVELVNLRGEIAREQSSAARKLEDALKEDLALRRFSVISFDRDLKANERAIRRQVERDHIVGSINANGPDFEFANFLLYELVEIAASMDERRGFDGGRLRQADWKGVETGGMFAEVYKKVSERRCSPKGKDWGQALASHAVEHPANPQSGAERPLLRMVSAAMWGWISDYDFSKQNFTFDPKTFEPKRR